MNKNLTYIFVSKKMFVFLLLVIVGLVVELYSADGLSSELKDLLIFLGSAYLAANVGAKVITNKKESINVEPADDTRIVELEAITANLAQNVEQINLALSKLIKGGK